MEHAIVETHAYDSICLYNCPIVDSCSKSAQEYESGLRRSSSPCNMTATLRRLDRLTTEMRLNKVASKGSIAQTFGDEEHRIPAQSRAS
jgi:hypothetical protein